MPDSRSHRGPHPEDVVDFAEARHGKLRAASEELSFLLARDYAIDASVKLVGDHHQLTVRQRKAVLRASCAPAAVVSRRERRAQLDQLQGGALAVDGFNVLITVEALLSGAPLFRGRDGALRDLASVHGTYRSVDETGRAVALIVGAVKNAGIARLAVYLDRPVGNSGRTRALFAATCERLAIEAEVVLTDRVDSELIERGEPVASSDSWILDRAPVWVDLPATLSVPPWLVDFYDS